MGQVLFFCFLDSFIEVKLKYNKLLVFKMLNLISWLTYKPHEAITTMKIMNISITAKHFLIFLCNLSIPPPTLPPNARQPLIRFLSLQDYMLFLEFHINGVKYYTLLWACFLFRIILFLPMLLHAVLHHMDIPQFIYLFTIWWTHNGVVSSLGLSQIKLL